MRNRKKRPENVFTMTTLTLSFNLHCNDSFRTSLMLPTYLPTVFLYRKKCYWGKPPSSVTSKSCEMSIKVAQNDFNRKKI